MKSLKFFTYDELKRVARTVSGEAEFNPAETFSEDALRKLDLARSIAGIPFRITCSYRSVDYELSQGRKGTSAHTEGCAFDISARTSRDRYKIVRACLDAGFCRIGIAKTFIHVDDSKSPGHSQQVIWLY